MGRPTLQAANTTHGTLALRDEIIRGEAPWALRYVEVPQYFQT